MRTWTSRNGQTIKGSLVLGSLKGNYFKLKKEDGKVIRVKVSILSEADKKFLTSGEGVRGSER